MQSNFAAISDRLGGILSDLSSFIGEDSRTTALPVCESRDRDSFIKRVHTFKSSTWFAKPSWLSPIICACYGWVNVDVDVLHCVGCQSVLAVRTPSSFDPAIYDACQKRLEDQLKRTAHHPCCTWPSCPTPSVIIFAHTGSTSQAIVADDFINKAQLLCFVGKDLPAVEHSSLSVTESDITALCSLVRNSPNFLHDAEIPGALESAVLLALTGWDLGNDGKAYQGCTSVQCSLCMRQAGLWNYISIAGDSDTIASVEIEPLLDQQMNAGKEYFEDVETSGSNSAGDVVNGQLLQNEVNGMQSAADDTNFSADVETTALSQDDEAINDTSRNGDLRLLTVDSNKDDDSESVTDGGGVGDTDEHVDRSDLIAVECESLSDFLPDESKMSMCSVTGEVEDSSELTANTNDNETMSCDGLQTTGDLERQGHAAADFDVREEPKIEQSSRMSDALDVSLESDNTSEHEETLPDGADSAAEEIVNDAADVLTCLLYTSPSPRD